MIGITRPQKLIRANDAENRPVCRYYLRQLTILQIRRVRVRYNRDPYKVFADKPYSVEEANARALPRPASQTTSKIYYLRRLQVDDQVDGIGQGNPAGGVINLIGPEVAISSTHSAVGDRAIPRCYSLANSKTTSRRMRPFIISLGSPRSGGGM
jgi:hypothetical protein